MSGVSRRQFVVGAAGAGLLARCGRLPGQGWGIPDRRVAALCRGVTKGWPRRWPFAWADGVGPTNNGWEQPLRPAVLWRTSRFGSDSVAGTRFAARLLTGVATGRPQGRPLRDLLVAAGDTTLQGTPRPSLLTRDLGR